MSDTIKSLEDIQGLIVTGFSDWSCLGDVTARERDNLVIFNYTKRAVYKDEWNLFERLSRGLIIDRATGEIAARSYDKFFNWGESGRKTDAPIVSVSEKMDGVLGILYRHKGGFHIATRGSFDSEYAIWATEWFHKNCKNADLIHDYHTFLFEIIYPGSKIIVDYDYEGLVLLDIRDRFTGEYLPDDKVRDIASLHGFRSPLRYSNLDVDDLLALAEKIPAQFEGYVATFADGQRFKFKGDSYRQLNLMIRGASFKKTLRAVKEGRAQQLLDDAPAAVAEDVEGWLREIRDKVSEVINNAEKILRLASETSISDDRKALAAWLEENHPRSKHYVFALKDGLDVAQMVYSLEFHDRTK